MDGGAPDGEEATQAGEGDGGDEQGEDDYVDCQGEYGVWAGEGEGGSHGVVEGVEKGDDELDQKRGLVRAESGGGMAGGGRVERTAAMGIPSCQSPSSGPVTWKKLAFHVGIAAANNENAIKLSTLADRRRTSLRCHFPSESENCRRASGVKGEETGRIESFIVTSGYIGLCCSTGLRS